MTQKLRAAFSHQSEACAALGSPFMAQLCRVLAERLSPDCALTRRLFDWPGDVSASAASLPLRLAGGLHQLVLARDPALSAVYPPHVVDDETLWLAVNSALKTHALQLDRCLDSPPQTNEVRRAAVLIAAGRWLAGHFSLPFILSELGASAGLNLNWDLFGLAVHGQRLGPPDPILTLSPNWTGPVPVQAPLHVTERAGVDLNPIDASDPQQRLRLMSYLWPDQPHRATLTSAAIAAKPPCPDRADAIDWLAPRLTHRSGHLHLIWSTIAWQYFPASAQTRGRSLIEAAGAKATADTPLAWLSYEADGQTPGAAITLRLWPGDHTYELGRADFHGRWVNWRLP